MNLYQGSNGAWFDRDDPCNHDRCGNDPDQHHEETEFTNTKGQNTMSDKSDYLWFTVRQSSYGSGVDVHGFKEATSGVLKGQTIKTFIDSFETEAEAFAAFPDAKYGSKWTDPVVSLSHLPSEDDPVAGGMYPDDYDDAPSYDGDY